jgi:trigger factor
MQVSVESTGALERRMEILVPADEIDKVVDERLQKLSRQVRLKGFRPGKVPVKVVRQQFGQQVRQEVLGDVVQSSFNEAVKQENLVPAGGPRIEPISTEQGADLKYRAVFEVIPQIQLNGLEGIEVTRPGAEVTPADVDAMIQNLREQRTTYGAAQRPVQDTDRVTVDFQGSIDGQPFDGGQGQDVQLVVGAGRMLADFEAGLRGMQAGEEKTIELTFPANYGAKALAGRQASFRILVKNVEQAELPEVDDGFCKAYGVDEGGVERLREEVADNMRRELGDAIRSRVKKQVMDGLLAANPLELPNILVDGQVRELQHEAGRRMGAKEASQLPAASNFVDAARRRVALVLLVREIIRRENMTLDQAKVQARFQELADQFPDAAQALQTYRSNPQIRQQMEDGVMEDQVVDWLLERAAIIDQQFTFRDLMNFGA